jgi:hypothetical protein
MATLGESLSAHKDVIPCGFEQQSFSPTAQRPSPGGLRPKLVPVLFSTARVRCSLPPETTVSRGSRWIQRALARLRERRDLEF